MECWLQTKQVKSQAIQLHLTKFEVNKSHLVFTQYTGGSFHCGKIGLQKAITSTCEEASHGFSGRILLKSDRLNWTAYSWLTDSGMWFHVGCIQNRFSYSDVLNLVVRFCTSFRLPAPTIQPSDVSCWRVFCQLYHVVTWCSVQSVGLIICSGRSKRVSEKN